MEKDKKQRKNGIKSSKARKRAWQINLSEKIPGLKSISISTVELTLGINFFKIE